MIRIRTLAPCMILAVMTVAAGGNAGTGHGKKYSDRETPSFAPSEESVYLDGRVIVRLLPEADLLPSGARFGNSGIDEMLSLYSVNSVEPLFPSRLPERKPSAVDLSLFYVVRYSAQADPPEVSRRLSELLDIQFAEPWFIHPTSYDPNDPSYGSQYALTRIDADLAWDLTHGDTSVVIGIVDSGVDLDHPDLSANIWHNPGETGTDSLGRDKRTNNMDDDANGYVDDWQGWDFGGADYTNVVPDNDPNPTGGNNAHGTHVAGIASAVTDNGIGVAGTGFNTRLLPIKTSADNDTRAPGGLAFIIAGVQGIAYAAAMGADVMNCSWGGGGGSQVEQEIIRWATDQGTLIVASSGNGNTSAPNYPAAYDGVLSVGATNASDIRSSYSNYGHTVDVSAPGDAILSTYYPATYATLFGTSMSSPHAAGAAALIKAMNPGFTALQVGERLRVTCDDINGLNPSYTDLLGKGRINIYRALTEDPPSVRASEMVLSDSAGGNNNGILEPGESIDLVMTFRNYLAPTSNALITLTETSSYVTVTDGEFMAGAIGTLDSVRNSANPFRFSIAVNVPAGHVATMKLLIDDGSYSDYQWFTVVINPTFQSHDINDVHVTLTNNGRIGFNDYSANTQGIGFLYPATSLNHIFEGGLIIGYSAERLVNNIRTTGQTSQDNDFLATGIYQLVTPGTISNQDGATSFSDSLAPLANRVGLRVDQFSYAFSTPEDSDYVIIRYDVTNLTGSMINGLYLGLFFDWDIANYATNRTSFDASRDLVYAWDDNTPTAPHIGVRAFNGAAGARGIVNNNVSMERNDKFTWISGGITQTAVGPGDIFYVISSGPYSIGTGETETFGFGIAGGSDLPGLQAAADAAGTRWEEILTLVDVGSTGEELPTSYSLDQNFPNPFNPLTSIRYEIPVAGDVSLRVYNLLGEEVAVLAEGNREAGRYSVQFDAGALPSGVYFYRLTAGSFNATRKALLVR